MHFSVAMHADRRLARWVAWNIDGLTRWDGDDGRGLSGRSGGVTARAVSATDRDNQGATDISTTTRRFRRRPSGLSWPLSSFGATGSRSPRP